MDKRRTSIDIPAAMDRQIDYLKTRGHGSTVIAIIRVAVDRMYWQERQRTERKER